MVDISLDFFRFVFVISRSYDKYKAIIKMNATKIVVVVSIVFTNCQLNK